MNMHGIIQPDFAIVTTRKSRFRRAMAWLRAHYLFGIIVVLPTLVTAGYLFLVASNQYASEAHFLVRSNETAAIPAAGGGLGQLLSIAGGSSSSQSEAMSVADYLSSHDAVAMLQRDDQLIERYSHSGVDVLSRLRLSGLTPERLLRYYRSMVSVDYNTSTGITSLTVRSFRPQDSYEILKKLLELGENRVNELNHRAYADSLGMARQQLAEAESGLARVQAQMKNFRQTRADIDPTATGQSQLGIVRSLTERLTAARAQLSAMRGAIAPGSPQLQAQQGVVRALEGQVAAQSSRLTGSDTAIAADIGGYESLKLRQEFLSKRYESASAALSLARQQVQRQQLYIVHVVEPNMPVKSLFPERWRITGTVLVATLLIYSIGWLIAAGVREHAA